MLLPPLFRLLSEGEVRWPLADHLGTIRELVDSDGDVLLHRDYDAFGGIVNSTGAADALFAFTGKLLDDATGLQNHWHRWYDAGVGEWLSEDPIGFAGGDENLERYAGNRPTYSFDPSGLVLMAFDGTSNNKDDAAQPKTNVAKFYERYNSSMYSKYYYSGVGTKWSDEKWTLLFALNSPGPGCWAAFTHKGGLAFGAGSQDRVDRAIADIDRYLNCNNDRDIDIIGFSRGSAIARIFANALRTKGILEKYGARIRFLGLFDTVATMNGVAGSWGGMDLSIDESLADATFQAVSAHEDRAKFPLTPVNRGVEVWFPGGHGDIGGGMKNSALSDITLYWMINHAQGRGVPVRQLEERPLWWTKPAYQGWREDWTWSWPVSGRDLRQVPDNAVVHPSLILHSMYYGVPSAPGFYDWPQAGFGTPNNYTDPLQGYFWNGQHSGQTTDASDRFLPDHRGRIIGTLGPYGGTE